MRQGGHILAAIADILSPVYGKAMRNHGSSSIGPKMVDLKINEIPDRNIRQKRLNAQRDDGRPTEDDIVRKNFGPKGENPDDPKTLPLEANTRRDWPIGG